MVLVGLWGMVLIVIFGIVRLASSCARLSGGILMLILGGVLGNLAGLWGWLIDGRPEMDGDGF